METYSKLNPVEIVNLSFTITSQLLSSFEAEIDKSNYSSFSSKGVLRRVEFLIENFKREEDSFLELCSEISDIPVKKLAFKGTEALLVAWKSQISVSGWFSDGGWWNSSLIKKITSVFRALSEDKKKFIELCK